MAVSAVAGIRMEGITSKIGINFKQVRQMRMHAILVLKVTRLACLMRKIIQRSSTKIIQARLYFKGKNPNADLNLIILLLFQLSKVATEEKNEYCESSSLFAI